MSTSRSQFPEREQGELNSLSGAIADFATAKSTSTTRKTRAWYSYMLHRFAAYLEESGYTGSDWCSPRTIEEYLAAWKDDGASSATVAGAYNALSAFFGWAVDRRLIAPEANPIQLVTKPKARPKPPPAVPVADYRRILASIPRGAWLDLRDRALIATLWNTGARVSEIAGLTVADVDLAARSITVTGKGEKTRLIPLLPDLATEIAAYVLSRPAWTGPELWLSGNGAGGVRGALTTWGIRRRLRELCKRAGVQYWRPHTWRHGLAMYLLNEAGADVSLISRIFGHSSTAVTTQVYARWTDRGLYDQFYQAMTRGREESQ